MTPIPDAERDSRPYGGSARAARSQDGKHRRAVIESSRPSVTWTDSRSRTWRRHVEQMRSGTMLEWKVMLGQSLTVFSLLTGLGVGLMAAWDLWSRPR